MLERSLVPEDFEFNKIDTYKAAQPAGRLARKGYPFIAQWASINHPLGWTDEMIKENLIIPARRAGMGSAAIARAPYVTPQQDGAQRIRYRLNELNVKGVDVTPQTGTHRKRSVATKSRTSHQQQAENDFIQQATPSGMSVQEIVNTGRVTYGKNGGSAMASASSRSQE
ncbi:MAG: hypothetical protein Q9166_002550 [cf. Caloplaca sp. 2 TL-2023]